MSNLGDKVVDAIIHAVEAAKDEFQKYRLAAPGLGCRQRSPDARRHDPRLDVERM